MSVRVIVFAILLLIETGVNAQTFIEVAANGVPAKRHECAAAVAGDAMYLFGGRGNRPVNRYDIKTNTWDSVGTMPKMMHHFQAVTYKGEIFIAGSFTGNYPHEKPVAEVYAFDTKTFKWRVETMIPADRQRGAAGCVIYNDKLYLIAGIIDGHYDGHVTWMDEYDFKSKQWKQLPDAPHARDHFQSVIVKNKLYNAGGRRSSAKTNETFQLTVPEVDVFDFVSGKWSTLDSAQNIPTQRAGCTSVVFGKSSFLVIGGESAKQKEAHSEAEVFDVMANRWVKALRLKQGRHGTQAVVYKKRVFIAAGSANMGGGPELDDLEVCRF